MVWYFPVLGPWLRPGRAKAEPSLTALARPTDSESQSRGFQAKPGQNITTHDHPVDISQSNIETLASKWPSLETFILACEPRGDRLVREEDESKGKNRKGKKKSKASK